MAGGTHLPNKGNINAQLACLTGSDLNKQANMLLIQCSWIQTIEIIISMIQTYSGFNFDYHPAAPGSNPKHTIYAFSICIIEIVMRKGEK